MKRLLYALVSSSCMHRACRILVFGENLWYSEDFGYKSMSACAGATMR